jgi:hypothetical protein
MNKESVVLALAALAHPVRLDGFRALVVAGEGGLAQKDLAEAGLVTSTQTGRYVVYRAAYGPMNALLAYLTDQCCAGPSLAIAAAPDPAPVATPPSSSGCGC